TTTVRSDMTTDPTPRYGSDSAGYPPPFGGSPGGLVTRFFARVIDGIIVGIVGFLLILGLSVHGPGGAAKPTVQQSAIRNVWTLLPIVPFIGGLLAFVAMVVIAI